MTSSISDLLERRQGNSTEFRPIPFLSELDPSQVSRLLIVSCADPRCNPDEIFKLRPGEAVIFKNAGGSVEHALQSILAMDSLIHFDACVVLKHTDCGATHFRDAGIKEGLKKRAPAAAAAIENMRFGEITGSLENSVKYDTGFLRSSPLVAAELRENVRGFVFDLKTGELREVL